MSHFDKNLPLEKYKNRLLDYLHMQGFDVEEGRLCSCPWHDDSTPSFNIYTDSQGYPAFKCFGCERKGDIYSAIGYCTGKEKLTEQFEEADKIFGTGEYTPAQYIPPPKKERFTFTPDKEALKKLTDWLESLPNREQNILSYFKQRIEYKTSGKASQYPLSQEQLNRLVTFFFWWPGKKAAEKALGRPLLFRAGVAYIKTYRNLGLVEEDTLSDFPMVGNSNQLYFERTTETCWRWNSEDFKYERIEGEPREIAWYHPGILAKSAEGFKLLYMNEKTFASEKRNPRTGVSFFPIPSELPEEKPIVLMEGEIDAVLCQVCGIDNAFSMGGLGNLSVPKIEKFILPKNIPEITLFADNDKAPKCQSQKAFGLMPYSEGDAIMETVPEKLIRAGFKGKIKVTSLPADCGFKDPDDAIRADRFDLVQEAIANARDYEPLARPEKTRKGGRARKERQPIKGVIYEEWDTIPLKFFRSLLKKFSWDEFEPDEKTSFLCAAFKACRADGAVEELISFSDNEFTKEELEAIAEQDFTPYHILELGVKYNVSPFICQKFEEMLVPAKEILRIFKFEETVVPIDYEKMIENENLIAFLEKKDNFFAAQVIADATDGNIIYVASEKQHYAFTGVAWEKLPGLAVEAHTILQNILLRYLEKNLDKKDVIKKIFTQIGSRQFRLNLVKDFNEFRGETYREEVMFDSTPIQATLTLKDGVIDFSDDKVRFRQATRDEYRRSVLPYTVSQLRKAGKPEQFLKLLESDFEPATPETLQKNPITTVQTLLYYLSLIQSRNTQYKYGGFFLGHGGTGKSTLCSIIDAIYPENCAQLQNEILVSVGRRFQSSNGPTPEIAKLEGKLIAFVQETPKDGRLNTNTFKLLTGGDKLSARFLNRDPHEFFPTAQILLSSNHSPNFEHGDDAAINRMIIFRFNIKHENGLKESKSPKEFIDELRPEFPAIIRFLAERYIELHNVYKGKIPMSAECINEKNLYIEEQERDTDRFVKACIKLAFNDNTAFTPSKDIYRCYLNFLGVQEGSKEAATQRQLTTWLKGDYVEFRRSYKQDRVPGSVTPEWGFAHILLSEHGRELLNKTTPAQNGTLDFNSGAAPETSPAPDDDPFADAQSPAPDSPDDDDEGDGDKYDIY